MHQRELLGSSYLPHEVQFFRQQLSKFEANSLFTFKVTDDRNKQI